MMDKNLKSLRIAFLLFFTLYTLHFTLYTAYAQPEGHKPEGSGLASDSQSHQMQSPTKEAVKEKRTPKQKDAYYCPMHPTYISDKPGDCPICNMKLVKKEEAKRIEEEAKTPKEICVLHNCPMLKGNCPMLISGNVKDCLYCGAHLAKAGSQGFYISPEKQQLIGVKVDKAISRPFVKLLRTVGRVAFDPGLYEAQAEYIEALKTQDKLKLAEDKQVAARIASLVDAARLKLELSGLSKEQIEDLGKNRKNDLSLLISSSGLPITWIYATIYEYELEYVKIGQEVSIKTVAYPDKEFKGTVLAIDPVFDTMTRSVRARIKAENKNALLKPNMYVDTEISSDLGTKLAVPREAVLDTGLRKIVFISLPEGRFESRQVKTGASSDNYVEITEGLQEGESVVTSGNFLIDSESKLKAALEGTSHQH